ncbi:hypothetical protein K1T71_009412 [Dendrolimus kikuchii]|uniref:Uncharacterized protein n=1 Tax=Dendrolimus kikuchii TaxID=765133 RepID=A0ACC1CUL7_9NEOP|nr:hypothetical protein K1T71_009412 [Dendrolimus kikuchii]
MEVGAVKQAFNNEVILLKKKLNQAKIQIIHKLTRKAKQLTEKKAPEKLKVKLKRKAESAVKEVLISKKIKARDIAKFIVTHKEELKTYLNRPQVDNDKACARLLLHKSMQEKYNFIRSRFSNVPIKDLFMSRQERLKLKKEEKEKQKNKKKGKNSKVVSEEGNWDIEDVHDSNNSLSINVSDDNDNNVGNNDDVSDDDVMSDNDGNNSNDALDQSSDAINGHLIEKEDDSDISEQSNSQIVEENSASEDNDNYESGDNISDDNGTPETVGKFVKLNSASTSKKIPESKVTNKPNNINKNITSIDGDKPIDKLDVTKMKNKKEKDNHKNRNLKEKIQLKKFKKTPENIIVTENKVVDPFFITSTGEHYMSLAEPRQPDEVKEIHKQGNRKLRRAVMFGHELKVKPRNYENNNFRKNDKFGNDFRGKGDRNAVNDKKFDFKNRNFDFHDKGGANHKTSGFNGRKGDFNNKKFNDKVSKFSDRDNEKPKDEKLHPSWEAKKRQSGILPFQGKKIVFDES